MLSNMQLIKRFLKARADVNKNAKIISDAIDANRDIDAVIMDKQKLESNKHVLDYSGLSYYILNINDNIVLLYPGEERQRYNNIRQDLQLGSNYVEYAGISYSEAEALKDFLDAGRVEYNVKMNDNMMIQFMIPQRYEDEMNLALSKLQSEIQSEIGKKYLLGKNYCFANTITQLSKCFDYQGDIYIGTEGGTSGIHINEDGAVLIQTGASGDFISKLDPDFENKVTDIVMNELKGDITPIKAFYGDFAKDISYGMSQFDIKKQAITKTEAMSILKLTSFPSLDTLSKMKESDKYSGKEKDALYALIRISLCRQTNLEDYKEFKLTKAEKIAYENMHANNIEEIEAYIGGELSNER